MIIDLIVVALILISAAIAFARGFIREVLTILGVVGGAVAAYVAGPKVVPSIEEWLGVKEGVEPERLFGVLPYDVLADIIAYGGIFIVVVIILSVISHMMATSAKALGLGAIDRTLGVVFGIARGVILLGLLYLPVHLLVDQETKEGWFEGSRTYFYLEQVSGEMAKYLPESAKEQAEEQAKKFQEAEGAGEKIDVLKEAQEEMNSPEGHPQPAPGPTPMPEADDEGYSEEFREKMDELFDEKSNPSQE